MAAFSSWTSVSTPRRPLRGSVSRDTLEETARAVKAIHNYPAEKISVDALGRIASLYPRPVAPQRWKLVEPEASERAWENDRSVSEEVFEAVISAVPLIRLTSSPERSVEVNLRQELNELVTQDFLGPNWRKKREETPEHLGESVRRFEREPDPEDALRKQAFSTKLRRL